MKNVKAIFSIEASVADDISTDDVRAFLLHQVQHLFSTSRANKMRARLVTMDVAVEAANEPYTTTCAPVMASICSDDGRAKAVFDCRKWLEQATDDEVMTLAAHGEWGGNQIAAEVAQLFAESNAEVAAVFHYLRKMSDTRRACGFECYVDAEGAATWLAQQRAHLCELVHDAR